MRITSLRALTGPNIYSPAPVLIMKLHLDDLTDIESREIPDFHASLLALLPGLARHHCSPGYAGGFVERLEEGTYFGHIVEHVALELTALAGVGVTHGKTRYAGEPGCYNVCIEYRAEQGTEYLLRSAVELVDALRQGDSYALAPVLEKAAELIARHEPGPSTKSIIDAARRRKIPWRRIGPGSLIELGWGRHRRFIQAAMTSQSSAVAVDISCDKEMTKTLLREASIRVPSGTVVYSEDEAASALAEIGAPVAVKPLNGCQARGITLNVSSDADIRQAYRFASRYSSSVVVEEMMSGRDYRVLVVNGRMVAASERIPAEVTGDGIHTIEQLIGIVNQQPERGEGHEKAQTRIRIDQAMTHFLSRRGLSLTDVPKDGEKVKLRECANLSAGGTARDVTDQVHPQIRDLCERAARAIGLDVCGIDMIAADITGPLQTTDGIIEINAAPGLRMHLSPGEGRSRDVGEAIIDTLYPAGENGRIPLISVTGTNGKTTITRMIGHAVAATGKVVGMTTTDGIFIDGREVLRGDTTGPRSARTVLSDPSVEVAVLETARGGILRRGLAYDWSDISVISNIRPDHLGQDGITSVDDLIYIKSLVAERVRAGGTLILNADDENLVQLVDLPRVSRVQRRIVWFSLRPNHVIIRRHLAAGGTAFLLRQGRLIEATQQSQQVIMQVDEIPATMGGAARFQTANALAAIAACRALGMPQGQIAAALREFRAGTSNSGRVNLYRVRGGYALLDYGHNPDAFRAICQMAAQWQGRQLTGIIGVPGDRDDEVIRMAGRAAAQGFHRIIIREDIDRRGRRKGEVPQILMRAMREADPHCDCRVIADSQEALRTALLESNPGGVVVIFYEKLAPLLEVLREFDAEPVDRLEPLPAEALRFNTVAADTAQQVRLA